MTDKVRTVTFITGNQSKLREVVSILGSSVNFEFNSKDIDLPEYQGHEDDICIRKCEDAYKLLNVPVIVEDTSLRLNALGGLPGPYIKWFLLKLGPAGLLKLLEGFSDKTASVVCTLAFTESLGRVKLFQGVTNGTIVAPRGTNGFGFDSCFLPDGYSQTYAEMSSDTKNEISHRYKAVKKMRDHFLNSEAEQKRKD